MEITGIPHDEEILGKQDFALAERLPALSVGWTATSLGAPLPT